MFLEMFRTTFFLVSICCCSFYWCHGCLEEERTLLLQIKDSINYPGGSSLDEVWIGKNCCQWYEVDCNPSSSRVILIQLYSVREERLGLWYPNISLFAAFKELKKLYLPNNNIGGWVMPQAFSEMQSLRELKLGGNNLSADIDSLRGICELTTLQVLDLDTNMLNDDSIPKCLGNLSLLEELLLWDNELKSYLTGLCELKNLRALNLDSNNLNGRALPPCLSNLSMLEDLSLLNNDLESYSSALTGICELTTLRSLSLGRNKLNDHSIPKCLGNLSLLEELYLWDNELKSYLTVFSEMQSLRELDLSSNNLSAGIESLRGLCELKDLRVLNLDENNLEYGKALHQCLSNLSRLEELYLYWNHLGSYPSALTGICELTTLRWLSLSWNRLNDHNIPKCLGNLSLLERLYLWDNELKSPFSSLTGICELRNLQYLDVTNNSYVGSIPQCFGNMNSLREIHLSYNQFTGTIPPSIFQNLTNLMIIYASDNQFNDSISFSMFANLSKLVLIDLSDNVRLEVETEHPHWVPTFQLQSLFLSNCILHKHGGRGIPTFISTQQSLKTLDLSHSFLKGTIPSWLLDNLTVGSLILGGNLLKGPFPQSTQRNNSMLNELDISDNKIFGELPSNIDILFPNLIVFNMSKNELRGTIPVSISKLQKLGMLDLSQNNLFGEMPHG